MGWLRRVRSSELNFGQFHHTLDRPAHYAPRDGISGGPRGTVSQRPCGVMPAWPFGFFYFLTVKIRTLGERPLLAPSGPSRKLMSAKCPISVLSDFWRVHMFSKFRVTRLTTSRSH